MAARPVKPDPVVSARVRALVDAHGMRGASRRLHLAEGTVARLVGGLPVTQGTELLARTRLDSPGEGPEAA